MVAVVESIGAAFVAVLAQTMALWRGQEVMREMNERTVLLWHDFVRYLLLAPTIVRKMEGIDAFGSIQLVHVIPRHSLSEFIIRLRSENMRDET